MVQYQIQDTDAKSSNRELMLSIIIPAYNESTNIVPVLDDLFKHVNKIGYTYEIFVVDDGSIDDTAQIIARYNVKIISHPSNLGKGEAIKSALKRASGQIIVTMDADGSHQAKDIETLIEPILTNDDVDAVMGSRFLIEAGKRTTTKFNMIGNTIFNLAIRVFTGKTISDSQSGFRAFRKEFINEMDLESSKFDIESELTIKTIKNGNRWIEVPIENKNRISGMSRLKPIRDGFKILMAVFRYSFMRMK